MTVTGATVEMAFGGAPHTPTGWSWTDITPYVLSVSTSRGRESRLEQVAPGTLALTVDNTDGRFDPTNLDGPYVSGGATQIRPKTPIRLTVDVDNVYDTGTYELFTGYLDDPVVLNHQHPEYSTVSFTATDALSMLASYDLPVLDIPIEDAWPVSWRATRILLDVGYTDSNTYDVNGDTLLGPTINGGNAAEAMANIAAAEGGALWVTGDGVLMLDDRYAVAETRRATTQATYDDTPGAFGSYSQPTTAINRNLYNVVTMTNERGTRYEATDATSIGLYGKRSYDISGAPIKHDAPAENRVDYWLQALKTPYSHIGSITVNVTGSGASNDPYNHWKGATLELFDRVRVYYRPARTPYDATELRNDVNIERIEHTFTGGRWTYRFTFSSRDRYEFDNPFGWFYLDDAAKGLDSIYSLSY